MRNSLTSSSINTFSDKTLLILKGILFQSFEPDAEIDLSGSDFNERNNHPEAIELTKVSENDKSDQICKT